MMIKFMQFVACVLGVLWSAFGEPRYEEGVLMRVNEGEKRLTQIMQYGEHPQYGKCWTTALEQVQEGCKRLTENEQSYMALTFANCHLEKAGRPTYPCGGEEDITDCLKRLNGDVIAFNAYTEFFTHTQDICFFLQSQVWREQTEEMVSRLARSSEDVATKMEVTGELQEQMMERQEASLQQQDLILQNEEKLRDTLQTSSQDIKNVFAEMRESTQTQKRLFEQTFSRVADIQHLILGEFSWFNSLLFFAAAVLIAYLVTSTPRTSGARLWLFIILGVDWAIERALFQVVGADQTQLYEQMWFCRKCFCAVALVMLCIYAYRYKDLVAVNNMLLLEIRRQNSELCRAMKGVDANSYPALATNNVAAAIQSSGATAMSVGAGHKSLLYGRDYCDSTPKRKAESISVIDGYSSDDITSTDSDPTFTGSKSSDTEVSDTESFITADQPSRPVSRRVSLDNRRDGARSSSAESSFVQGINQSGDASYIGRTSTAKRKRGRPKGSRSRQSSPQNVTPSQTRYNLRSRHPQSANNSILNTETVEMFMEKLGVALGSRKYQIERVEPPRYQHRRNVTSFSSDEEF